jgi:hypothetical protein
MREQHYNLQLVVQEVTSHPETVEKGVPGGHNGRVVSAHKDVVEAFRLNLSAEGTDEGLHKLLVDAMRHLAVHIETRAYAGQDVPDITTWAVPKQSVKS